MSPQDALIVNYILQGEYLQGEFYACAVSGQGLPPAVRGATPPAAGCAMAALSSSVHVRKLLLPFHGCGRFACPSRALCGPSPAQRPMLGQ